LAKRTISLPTMTRMAPVVPSSVNVEERTFDIVWTTGARVRRDSYWDGPFYEELGIKKSEVRMGRLKNGAPFLDNHGFTEARGVKQVLGVHTEAKLTSGKEGTATIKLSKRAVADGILDDIADGILRNVSVGYDIHAMRKVGEQDGVPIFRITDWEPIENSLVPAGADDLAMVRNKKAATREIEIEGFEDETPATTTDPEPDAARSNPDIDNKPIKTDNNRDNQPTGEPQMTPEEIEAKRKKAADEKAEVAKVARATEKKRISDIRSTVSKAGLDIKLADTYIEDDKSIDEVRELVIDALHEKDKKPEQQTRSTNSTVEVGDDLARKARVKGMGDSLLHRYRPTSIKDPKTGAIRSAYEMTDEAKPYAYSSLTDLARMCLEENGVSTRGLAKHQIAEKALQLRASHAIADFSEILANTVNRTLRDGYAAAPQTWRNFTNIVFVPDFKEISRTNLGDAPELRKVQENGEVERGTLSEAAEKYRVEEFARIVAISRKVIVNDDLNAMTRLPDRMGRRAADLESDTVWDIIKANPLMSDGLALFSAGHGNLSTAPAAPSDTGLGEARKNMRRQVGLDGAEISIVPIWMYVPPEHETAAEKLIASIVPDSSTNVSPFSSSGRTPLQLAVEPRIETGVNGTINQWFETSSLDQVDMMEMAFLEGTDGPQMATREGFDVAGMELKITHDLGSKAIDHRGLFKNAGI